MRSLALLSVLFLLVLISFENGVNSQWTPRRRQYACPSQPETRFDALGRRDSGLLVPPQYQGSCGSCWAFAATHTFADQINIDSDNLVARFSPDHLAKCSPYSREGNGCCGGSLSASISFLKRTGAYSDLCYPYTLQNYSIPRNIRDDDEARIQYKNANPLMCPNPSACANGGSVPTPQKLLGATAIARTSTAVTAALNSGPLYMVMSIGGDAHNLNHYGCGIFTDPVPFPFVSSGYHAVEIVDYSSSLYGDAPFYVVKNSWGSSWGEEGYFRILQSSRLIVQMYAFTTGSSTSSEEIPVPVSQSTCSAVKINATKHPLVNASVTFALEQLNSMNLLTCLAGSGTPTVEQTSVINATEQVVAGMITDVALRVAVTGCTEDAAILRVVVLENMNGTLTLLDYSYTTASAALLLHSYSFGLLLALLGLFFGLA